jgi:hypothetical protein
MHSRRFGDGTTLGRGGVDLDGDGSFSAGGSGSRPEAARGEGEEGVARGCERCEEEG